MSEKRRETPLPPFAITTDECTFDMKRRIIAALPLLQDLSDEELRTVEPVFRELGFEAGERVLPARSSDLHGLSVVGAGFVKLIRGDYEGRDVVLDFLVTGEPFGPAVGSGSADLAIAHTAVCVFHVDGGELESLFRRRPQIASRLIELTAARVADLHDRLHLLSGASARTRIVATLRRLASKVGRPTRDGVLLEIPLSREDLASICGTTPETASRVVSALQRAGQLKTGRRWFTLTETFPHISAAD
jgi:CRP/FNR family transcriptional regulator, nitrogen oxide reductase regulator